jgi:arylsulfatase A-like enzyme
MPYQPHIVFVLTDQQRYDTIAALGYDYMETPALDRLVEEGVSFDSCYITAPSCVPSRCSLFQGYYPHTTGVYKNGDRWTESWASNLTEAGYHCVNVGKMHTVPLSSPAGFHERYIVENKDRFLDGRYFFDEWDKALRARGLVKQQRELYRKREDYGDRMGAFAWELDEDMQSDAFVGGFAEWWLTARPVDTPLFLQVGFPGPHPPYDPIPRWLDRYREKDLPIRDFAESDIAAQPVPLQSLREHMIKVDHDSVVHVEAPTHEQRHFQRACYLANVSMIDEQIGILMETLERQQMLTDTVIIFASDHGDSLGDHGHSQKWTMYEETVHVPALLWAGDNARKELSLEGAAGRRVDALCSLFDIGPTILDLASAPTEPDMEAVSLLPQLRRTGGSDSAGKRESVTGREIEEGGVVSHSDAAWDVAPGTPQFVNEDGSRQFVFAEHGRDNILEGTAVMTMVRDSRWKLVTFAEGGGQLFDLENDPDEVTNLWNSEEAASERHRLTAVLHDWYRDSLYRTRTRRRR